MTSNKQRRAWIFNGALRNIKCTATLLGKTTALSLSEYCGTLPIIVKLKRVENTLNTLAKEVHALQRKIIDEEKGVL